MAMHSREIIDILGGITAVAKQFGIKPPSVHHWATSGIPEGRLREMAAQLEFRTGGRFNRRERWPETYGFFWPELAQPESPVAGGGAPVAEQEV